jgi:hypothetical protein
MVEMVTSALLDKNMIFSIIQNYIWFITNIRLVMLIFINNLSNYYKI